MLDLKTGCGLDCWAVWSCLPCHQSQHRHSSLQPPCSGYPGTQPTSRQLLWEQRERSRLKDKTGANSIHRLKIYLWGIQFNRFGKQTKWHDLQRLQGGTSKIYKPQNKWKEVPNFCPGPIVDFLMIYPWHWSRSFIYYPVLKLYILPFFHIWSMYTKYMIYCTPGSTQESLSCYSSLQMIISLPFPSTVV